MRGFRGLKKLEELNLADNLIEDASVQETGFQMVSLTEVNLSGNKISTLGKLFGFPYVRDVILDRNPITKIESIAFSACPELVNLSMNSIKLPNYHGDLRFLRQCQNLEKLSMNYCFTDSDFKDVSSLPDLFKLRNFSMRGVGLIKTTDLHFKMPILEILDLQDNKIFEVESIDDLSNFTSLVEVNFAENPINVHKNLQEMMSEANPMLEIINKRQVQDIGYREQQEIREIRRQIIEYEAPVTGTTRGD